MSEVVFIGAGPGDPDLITIKGKKAIDHADVIIYAGSLVNPEVLRGHKPMAEIYNSAALNLDEVLKIMCENVAKGRKVARVHTGDPSLYGAIQEQMDHLKKQEIPFSVIPGVSSFTAAASALKREFTLPDVTQTVILTRMEGRTPVPEKEKLRKLAAHRASMAIFLSVRMIDLVSEELIPVYGEETPVAVVQRASWPDEKIVTGCLKDIAHKVKEAGITKTAQILVGDFLKCEYSLSKLYDRTFTHEYRKGIPL